MQRILVKSKIHKAIVTEADLKYEGSITIDADLLDKVDIWPGEKVLVVDNTNGARLETYVIKGEKGSGQICINGAAAHLIKKGDEVIIISFCVSEKSITPKLILVDSQNRFLKDL